MPDIRLGALCWNQYTTWPAMLEAGMRADRLGYDTLWTWDHLYPIVGSDDGPILEGWLTLAAWAQATERIRIGLMVGANTFREPSLTAKMATTLDHISGGRAILGIGGAWFETEHEAFGLAFGDGLPERLRWLAEALPIMRGMLHGERPTAAGPALFGEGGPQPPAAHPGAAPAPHRWWRRAGHAQARGSVRRRQQRRWWARERDAQGSDPAAALRDRRARPVRDRTDDRASGPSSSAIRTPTRSVSSARSSLAMATRRSGRISRSGRSRRSPSASRRTSNSAIAISSLASRGRTTRSR